MRWLAKGPLESAQSWVRPDEYYAIIRNLMSDEKRSLTSGTPADEAGQVGET